MITNTEKGIAVYCASSTQIAPEYFEQARLLGGEIARSGVPLITGAGKMGLMQAVNDGAIEAGGTTIGVIPQFMVDADRHHKHLSQLIVTPDMHVRKKTMADLSQAVIALPGGVGTFDELMEIITWRKLSLYHGNVVIFNINGYYDNLLAMFDTALSQGFMYGTDWRVATSATEAVALALKQ